AQVAVEIRVQPNTGADRAFAVGVRRRLPVPDHPAGAARFNGRVDEAVAGEATPSLKFGADARVGAGDRQQIARTAAPQRGNQFRQEAGGKGLRAGVDLDVRYRWHALHYNVGVVKSKALAPDRRTNPASSVCPIDRPEYSLFNCLLGQHEGGGNNVQGTILA